MDFKRYAVFAALLTVTLAALTLPANAQQYKATFTLPFEVHWSSAVLPAGDYSVRTDTLAATPILYVSGNGKTVMLLGVPLESMDRYKPGGRLAVQDVNGTKVVTKFQAGAIGKEYSFAIPKSVAREGYGVAALKSTTVPVSSSR